MDKRLQTQVLALAMQIIGIKDPNLFKQAITMMSEQGRAKFLNKCAEIILSGDTSEENIAQAQQEALKAIEEGQQGQLAILAKHGNRITYLNRFYSGGAVKTFDGGYMKLKRPLNKNQVEGRESIGLYKGLWMYLNGDKVAVPNLHGKLKGEDGSVHVNRAYNGMLLPKPQRYSLGGIFSSIGNWMGNAAKDTGSWLKGAGSTIGKGLNSAVNFADKNQNWITAATNIGASIGELLKGMNMSNIKHPAEATAHILNATYLGTLGVNSLIEGLKDRTKYKQEKASANGSPLADQDLYLQLLYDKLVSLAKISKPEFPSIDYSTDNSLYQFPKLEWNLDTSLLYPRPDNNLTLNIQ